MRHIFLAIFNKKNCKNCVCLSEASYAVFVIFKLECCVKKGHRLRFTAQGADAEQALKAIGDAIAAGLGEGA